VFPTVDIASCTPYSVSVFWPPSDHPLITLWYYPPHPGTRVAAVSICCSRLSLVLFHSCPFILFSLFLHKTKRTKHIHSGIHKSPAALSSQLPEPEPEPVWLHRQSQSRISPLPSSATQRTQACPRRCLPTRVSIVPSQHAPSVSHSWATCPRSREMHSTLASSVSSSSHSSTSAFATALGDSSLACSVVLCSR
jgi:hypothetical protein